MHIGIVGAGMAGLSCADALVAAGHSTILFDKGRGAGGRMATRRMDTPAGEAAFDHGAQYFTVRDPEFSAVVANWEAMGHAARWPSAGPDAWVGVPGMNGIIREMSDRHDVRFGTRIKAMERSAGKWSVTSDSGSVEGGFDAVVMAVPAEQAATLLSLHDFELARVALRARSQPCWTGMFAFSEPLDAPDTPIRDRDGISWAVRNRSKPGRSGPETWVVQAQPLWTEAHLEEDADHVRDLLLGLLGGVLERELPAPIAAAAHRWRFAMSAGTGDTALWNDQTMIGACGDWLVGPRIECAWLSGMAMAQAIAESSNAQVRAARS